MLFIIRKITYTKTRRKKKRKKKDSFVNHKIKNLK